jgi:NAD+ diphosphatase
VDRAGVAAALAGQSDAPFGAPPPYAIANTLMKHWIEAVQEGRRRSAEGLS